MEFRGTIEMMSASQWMVSGYTVTVDQNTEIKEENGAVAVGAVVDVDAITQADGSLYARTIKVKEGKQDSDIEFKGQIEAIDGQLWTISGREIIVDAVTVINDSHGPAVVGAAVEVKAEQLADGSLHALRIKVETPETPDLPQVEFNGTIDSIGVDQWTVGGRVVLVDVRTQFIDEHAPLVVGALVDVMARQQADGSLWAESIRSRKPEDVGRPEIEWEGTIESMSAVSWTVASQIVLIDPDTVIDESEGPAQVGAQAKVTAVQQADGTLLARRIRIQNDVPDGSKTEFRGTIEVMTPSSWTVSGQIVAVDNNTLFDHLDRAALGATAEVKARRLADGTLLALKIEVVGNHVDMLTAVEWSGPLESFDANMWMVAGRAVQLTVNTSIEGVPQSGATVEVYARVQTDGTLIATRLRVEAVNFEVEWRGVVESIASDTWQIGGVQVQVDGRTVFDESHGVLDIGVSVVVKAIQQADGSLIALQIKVGD